MAASATPINGSNVIIRISSDAGSTYDIFGFATSATLSLNMDTRDVTSKQDCGWRALKGGMKSWSLSGDGFLTYLQVAGEIEQTTLTTALFDRAELLVDFTTWDCENDTIIAGDANFSGSVLVTSYEITGGVEDNATYSFTFEGTGALTEGVNP